MMHRGAEVAAATCELPAERLRWQCVAADFESSEAASILPPGAMVGQDRGLGAVEFALAVAAPCYNVFVAGPPGSGRTTAVRDRVERAAAGQTPPSDWGYVYNFADPYRPIAVELPTGRGPELARDVDQLVASCRREIPRVFEGEQYQQRRSALVQEMEQQRERLLGELRAAAERVGFTVQVTPMGLVTAPLVSPGQPMSREAFELLPETKQASIRAAGQQLERQVEAVLLATRRAERETREQLETLDREAALFAVGHYFEAVRVRYAEIPRVVEHLAAVQQDLVDHLDDFRAPDQAPAAPAGIMRQRAYERYGVNVLVSHDPTKGAPVVFEPNPTFQNLVGRLDYHAMFGAMLTDYTLIKPGALHRANGGYLMLQARDVLQNPFTWDALKRALRDGEVRVESAAEQLNMLPTATIKAEPIRLRVKVVLVGDLTTYLLLYRLDEQFSKLFRVKAQFSGVMDRTPAAMQAYAAFVRRQVSDDKLLPFDATAIADVLEHGARLAEHQERLSARFSLVAQLVVEADAWARRAGAAEVTEEHVRQALAEQAYRANLLEEESQRLIDEGVVAIDTRTSVVGQINGLSVLELGDYAFARPSRITARTAIGGDGVVNLEREVQQSGPSHSKGVLILGGYLLGQYGAEHPLALSARLAFEQVYDEVDGDSASSAELYALLSSLAELPISQSIAVTGSVDQLGRVQAVGAVTRKIVGFFKVCQSRGLTGEQGVVIPASNARHLMLEQEVVGAVSRGEFHVWAVHTVDEGIEILTGVPAGQRQADGTFPEGSVHGRVQRRLESFMPRRMESADGHRLLPAATRRRSASKTSQR
ncbi:MAG: AAA family ATPase [Chloroflexi bacterium]|nr:AAA family ATPase [Chloroflexota bacterium]